MRVFVTGATGLVGSALCTALLARGDDVIGLSRVPQPAREASPRWLVGDPAIPGPWQDEIEGASAVVHLAGESIASGRWTQARKARLVASRIDSTRLIAKTISNCADPPTVWVNASATGYYGSRGEELLSEDASPGDDFLARLCCDWEAEALAGASEMLRIVCMRFGVVLSSRGGALAKMLPPFRLGLGGPVGPRDRWFPWIHEHDAVGLLVHALQSEDNVTHGRQALRGPVNATAPATVRMGEFASTLGEVLRRPALIPVPLGLLRIPLGEFAALLSPGQRVGCERALAAGYRFAHPTLVRALRECLD
jgi:uncharacterized protein (TIGR01777 family)